MESIPHEVTTHPTLLAAVAKLDNPEAWKRFVACYEPFIRLRCRQSGLSVHDTEDITQTVMVALVRRLPGFQLNPQLRFRGYLTTIVLNAVRTHWAKDSRCPGGTGLGGEDSAWRLESAEVGGTLHELAKFVDCQLTTDLQILNAAIERVKARVESHTWQAYWLTAVENDKPADVAARLNVSCATVYMAKQRVGDMLRDEAGMLRERSTT